MRFKPLDPPKGGFFYAVVDKICFKFFLPLYFFSSVGEKIKVFYLIILVSIFFVFLVKVKLKKRHLFWIIPLSIIFAVFLTVLLGHLISPVKVLPISSKYKEKQGPQGK